MLLTSLVWPVKRNCSSWFYCGVGDEGTVNIHGVPAVTDPVRILFFPREALEFPYDLSGDSFIFSFSRLQVFSALFVWYVPKYRDPARDISC